MVRSEWDVAVAAGIADDRVAGGAVGIDGALEAAGDELAQRALSERARAQLSAETLPSIGYL